MMNMQPNMGGMPANMGPFMAAAMARQGRNGDTMMAHMAPGEIAVPPQLQSDRVLATLNQEYGKAGVSPGQFQAGNPQASVNPATGMPQFNFLDAFLPIALSMAGNAVAPGVGSALGMTAGSAGASMLPYLLGAAGGAVGSKLTGGSTEQALMSGAGGALGSWGMNKLFGPAAAAGQGASQGATATGAQAVGQGATATGAQGASGLPWLHENTVRAPNAGLPWANQPTTSRFMQNLPQTIGAGLGAGMGNYMAKPAPQPQVGGRSFNERMRSPGELPSYQSLLGQDTYNGPPVNSAAYVPPGPGGYRYVRPGGA